MGQTTIRIGVPTIQIKGPDDPDFRQLSPSTGGVKVSEVYAKHCDPRIEVTFTKLGFSHLQPRDIHKTFNLKITYPPDLMGNQEIRSFEQTELISITRNISSNDAETESYIFKGQEIYG